MIQEKLKRPRGEDHWNSVLDSQKVLSIIRMYQIDGMSQQSIADVFGVSKSTVSAIVKGWTWGHVTGIRGKRVQIRKRQKSL